MGAPPSETNARSRPSAASDAPATSHAVSASASGDTPRVGVIRNIRSHRNKGQPFAGRDIPGVMTVEPESKQEIGTALARFAQLGIDVLVISGGDGTVRDVLTRGASLFSGNWPAIIVLPQGKTNALAVDLGIPTMWSLPQALAAWSKGAAVTRAPLVVTPRSGDGSPRYGFILGAGVFNAAIDAGQVAHRFGAFQSFAVGITAVFGLFEALLGFGKNRWRQLSSIAIEDASGKEAVPASVHATPGMRYIAVFTSLSRFPLGLRPFAGLKESGEIRYLVLDAPVRRAVTLLPLALFGTGYGILRKLGLHRGKGDSYEIRVKDNFILDGETYAPGDYHLEAGPDLKFVAP